MNLGAKVSTEESALAELMELERRAPFLHRAACTDRYLTGVPFAGVLPDVTDESLTWRELLLDAASLVKNVRDRLSLESARPLVIVGDRLLYQQRVIDAVAQASSIPYWSPYAVPHLDGRLHFEDGSAHDWRECVAEYQEVLASGNIDRSEQEWAESHLEHLTTARRPPEYMRAGLPGSGLQLGLALRAVLGRVWRSTFGRDCSAGLQSYGPSLSTSVGARLGRAWSRRRSARYYKRVSQASAPSQPYVVYYLHVQPELTVEHWSFDYQDQVATIRNIVSRLPANYVLAVKEHPVDAGRRHRSFYAELASIPGVTILDSEVDSRDLMRGAELAVTLAGTASLEAMCLGIPAVVFGAIYFGRFAGVRQVSSFDALGEVVAGIPEFSVASTREKVAALVAMKRSSFYAGALTEGKWPAETFSAALIASSRRAGIW